MQELVWLIIQDFISTMILNHAKDSFMVDVGVTGTDLYHAWTAWIGAGLQLKQSESNSPHKYI